PLAAIAVAVALLALAIVPRIDARAAQRAQVAAQQALPVSVILPGAAPTDQTLTLPGSVMPYAEASIYARTSGYIAHWSVDIGTHVKAGATLAQIAAPDLDAQLRQGGGPAAPRPPPQTP
ncbi:RND family efflux transporter MFP subunit, partial [Burkholderia sp. TJI49]